MADLEKNPVLCDVTFLPREGFCLITMCTLFEFLYYHVACSCEL